MNATPTTSEAMSDKYYYEKVRDFNFYRLWKSEEISKIGAAGYIEIHKEGVKINMAFNHLLSADELEELSCFIAYAAELWSEKWGNDE